MLSFLGICVRVCVSMCTYVCMSISGPLEAGLGTSVEFPEYLCGCVRMYVLVCTHVDCMHAYMNISGRSILESTHLGWCMWLLQTFCLVCMHVDLYTYMQYMHIYRDISRRSLLESTHHTASADISLVCMHVDLYAYIQYIHVDLYANIHVCN